MRDFRPQGETSTTSRRRHRDLLLVAPQPVCSFVLHLGARQTCFFSLYRDLNQQPPFFVAGFNRRQGSLDADRGCCLVLCALCAGGMPPGLRGLAPSVSAWHVGVAARTVPSWWELIVSRDAQDCSACPCGRGFSSKSYQWSGGL